MTPNEIIRSRVREGMAEAGIGSMQELAARLGTTSRQSVSAFLRNDKTNPNLLTLIRYAEALDRPLEWILRPVMDAHADGSLRIP